jgi:hypothetical protein
MVPITELISSSIPTLLEGMKLWKSHKEQSEENQNKKIEAISKIMEAVVATKGYLYDSKELGQVSREKEMELSKKWQAVASAIYKYDYHLFESANVKALGWADPNEWNKRENEATTVNLDEIIEQCKWHMDNIDEST